ncbi:MAG: substrate-binding domain-containing protein [Cyclobacteriaceae bacterium]
MIKNITACVLFIFLISCQNENSTRTIKIGFSQPTTADNWRKTMHEDMLRELSFYPEVELIIRDAENDSEKQISQIRELKSLNIDLLIVSPNQAEPITPIVEEVFQSGIPVVVLDRKISSKQYSAYVGANNREIGRIAGQYVANLLNGKGSIVEIQGLEGSTPALERNRGFLEALKPYPEVSIIAQIQGKWEQDTAMEVFSDQFESLKGADLIFAHNDMMALGAYQICNKNGMASDFKFVGIDGLAGPNGGIQLVSDGILDATVLYPTGGEEAIRLAMDILNNRPFNKENQLNTSVIDIGNVHIMKLHTDRIISLQKDIKRQENHLMEQIRLYYNQRLLIYFLLASLTITIFLAAFILYTLKEKQEINKSLKNKNSEIIDQRNKIENMAKEAEKANDTKMIFFTNISHEFKTPLTLIMSSAESLLDKTIAIPDESRHNLILIQKNASRLLRLINQLLDFRRIENSKMKLHVKEIDMVAFVSGIVEEFQKVAQKQKISLKFTSQSSALKVWIDVDLMDKVLFNLLSNAFKFTGENGQISVHVEEEKNDNVLVIVEDNGKGISKVHLDHLFERFYQGDDDQSLGTGLGLSLSYELVKYHYGDLSVESQKGHGTKFVIKLPTGRGHFHDHEIHSEIDVLSRKHTYTLYQDDFQMDDSELDTMANQLVPKNSTLLIIEDNDELRSILKSKFRDYYHILEAANGNEGLKLAIDEVPDLIVSDIKLPGKNGLDIARIIKNDLRTSHIPIILLTARHETSHQIKGIQTGADAYITKPFSMQYLKERIEKLLWNRSILKDHYKENANEIMEVESLSPLDRKFAVNFTKFIEANIHNSELSVSALSHELGLSRVQLYRKVKALFDCGVNDYIKSIRLNKAKQLLLRNEFTIAEVAYAVGFKTSAYFSTSFKAQFNISPSVYIQRSKHRSN